MARRARLGALTCALLASTCVASAALSQAAQPFRTLDANGVERRLARIANGHGFAIGFVYQVDGQSRGSQAPAGWRTRSEARFFNDTVSTTAPQASVAYAYPNGASGGTIDFTDMAGNVWRLTADSIRRPGESTPSFSVSATFNGYSILRDGVTIALVADALGAPEEEADAEAALDDRPAGATEGRIAGGLEGIRRLIEAGWE